MIPNNSTLRKRRSFELLFIFFVAYISFWAIPNTRENDISILAIVVITIAIISVHRVKKKKSWTPAHIGFQKGNFMEGLRLYCIVTALSCIGLVVLSIGLNVAKPSMQSLRSIIECSIIGAFFQAILFRAYFTKVLEEIFPTHKKVARIINVVLFTSMHLIYGNYAVVLPTVFIGGVIFVYLYDKFRNIGLIAMSQIVLNFTAIHMGIFPLNNG